MPGASVTADVVVARQPILDANLAVAGYELLFRAPGATEANVTESERATSRVIVDAIGEIGLEQLAGSAPAYVNVSADLLVAVRPLPLPPERVVLELLEDHVAYPELLAAARELKADGFTLALDDFVYHPELEPLLELIHTVKLDVLAHGRDGTLEQLEPLRGRGLTLVAEKVESREDFAFCCEAGFDLFQGFFYARPELMSGRGIPAERLGTVRTLAALQGAGGSFERLEEIIGRDVALSYKLLRYANSAYAGGRRSVGSVREALLVLGARTVQQWATVLTLAGVSDRPSELVSTGLLRAQACRQLAGGDGAAAERTFTTGLFSVLDALLGAPMEDVLEALPLDPEVADALLHGSGPAGAALSAVLAFERGVVADGPGAAHDVAAVGAAYRDALRWTHGVAGALA